MPSKPMRPAHGRRKEIGDVGRAECLGRRDHFVRLLQDDAEDLAEAQRHDRQIVAAQAQRRQADDVSGRGRHQSADDARRDEQPFADAQKPAVLGRRAPHQQRTVIRDAAGRVAAQGHEPRVADRKLPRHAVHDVQRHGQDHRDADVQHDPRVVGPDRAGQR